MTVFWEKGLAATSLDDLAGAMSMNRPSIYNAFGGKEDIYRRSLARFCGQLDDGMARTLEANDDVHMAFVAFFDQALEVYCGTNPPMGCLMICTAPASALSHPRVGEDLLDLLKRLDDGFAKRLRRAQREGALPPGFQGRDAARLLQATLQTLAIRARAGQGKRELRRLARYAVDTIVGPA